jgi:hypothetical protein
MERAVYAQCWFPRQHNYHPSLPPRRLKMVEDFSTYRATMLTWPALGGGGISLSYLEGEAWDPVPPRYRQYGFLNDSEFVKECHDRGIKAFSVIFCLQGWEFPAELSEDEDQVLAMNELRGVGKRDWLGLREFTQNRYPKIWKPFEAYFPDGLTNSAGEKVTDLWQECTSRDLNGEPIHADWLECPDREHACHLMDSNNPVWREYLKAIIRMHVDAGVDGIQFDEPDGPIAALKYGGCFCRDCTDGFRAYLNRLPADQVPDDLRAELPGFDYAAHLRGRGETRIDPRRPDFLARAYAQYQRGCTTANLRELVSYARSYAESVGRTVLLSANVFDGLPTFAPLAADLDILVPEQNHSLYRNPTWMRYIAGFAGGKDVAISLNPYGGVPPELTNALRSGRGLNHFRGMLYEAAACGVSLSVPYGAWLGSVIEDALYAPHDETVELQDFLADHEALFGTATFNEVAVAYSVDSNFIPVTYGNLAANLERTGSLERSGGVPDSPWSTRTSFTAASDSLSDDLHPYDAVMLYDGELAPDTVSADSLARYRYLVLPGCTDLTENQLAAVLGYLDQGGQVLVAGDLGPAGPAADQILNHERTRAIAAAEFAAATLGDRQLSLSGVGDAAANIQRTQRDTAALHIIRYIRAEVTDPDAAVEVIDDVPVVVRLPYPSSGAVYSAPGQPDLTLPVAQEGTAVRVTVPRLGQYGIVEFLR